MRRSCSAAPPSSKHPGTTRSVTVIASGRARRHSTGSSGTLASTCQSPATAAPSLLALRGKGRPCPALQAPQKQKLYIGFEKNDTKPREGRQGRFVTDDPSKYPQRNEYVGGWAGGEVGLKQFVEVGGLRRRQVCRLLG